MLQKIDQPFASLGRSQEQIKKTKKIRVNFVDVLAPHIQKFVRESHNEASPELTLTEEREANQRFLDGLELESGEVQADIAQLGSEDEGRKIFEEILQWAKKNL